MKYLLEMCWYRNLSKLGVFYLGGYCPMFSDVKLCSHIWEKMRRNVILKHVYVYLLYSLQVHSKDSSHMKLKVQDNTVILYASPFHMDFLSSDTPVMSLNSQGLLKYEQYRSKSKNE